MSYEKKYFYMPILEAQKTIILLQSFKRVISVNMSPAARAVIADIDAQIEFLARKITA